MSQQLTEEQIAAQNAAAIEAGRNRDRSKKTKYFRSAISGLTIILGEPTGFDVAPESIRFTPILERFEGDMIKAGYLATDDPRAIKRCRADYNVTEIDQDEYETVQEKAVDPDNQNYHLTGY